MPGKYISEEIKKLIVEAKQKGETDQEVADRFHVNQSTVSRIFKGWREAKTVKHKKISDRPRKTTSRQNRLLVRLVKADPFKTAVDVQTYAHENMGLDISIRTARRIGPFTNGVKYCGQTNPRGIYSDQMESDLKNQRKIGGN